MNKTVIKNFAIQSRLELIQGVKQKAFELGISEEKILSNTITSSDTFVVHGKVLDATIKKQRDEILLQIQHKGFNQLVEEVAYTWFNRLIALRFMEVNQYLPRKIRVFTNHENEFKPEILDQALHLQLDGLDKAKVLNYLENHQEEALYKYLLILQCNEMNEVLPKMFEKLDNYTEMLLPDGLLRSNGVIANMIQSIDIEDWKDQVQIIGWLYQYYNTDIKQEVFDGLKKNIKITKEKIPAATQLFTPDWIVRYMVENSLGRLWVEGHPNDSLQSQWKYYVEEAEQEAEVLVQLQTIREEYKKLTPEDIKVIDPCMGSGHILVYAFDVLMQIYLSEGYTAPDAAQLILEKNLYGLDIDRRAYQLAYFSLMMKARAHNRRILSLGVSPQVYEPSGYPEGMEYGSLIKVDQLESKPEAPQTLSLFDESYETKLNTWNFRRLLSQKYDVVVTNPPYAGAGGVNAKLGEFLKQKYPDSKSDMFAAFIEKCIYMTKQNMFSSLITQQAWMFLSSYEKLRYNINKWNTIQNMIHLGNGAFGFADFGLTAFTQRKTSTKDYFGTYYRLVEENNPDWKEEQFLLRNHQYITKSDNFSKIPGSPVAYWLNEIVRNAYQKSQLFGEIAKPVVGLQTGDNSRFLRFWFEIVIDKCGFGLSQEDALASNHKWFPYNKGGDYRKWYGNNEYVVNWENDGAEIKGFVDSRGKLRSRPQNTQYYFRQSITWSFVSSSYFGVRYSPMGAIFDVGGSSLFPSEVNKYYLIGFLCSKLSFEYMKIQNSTMNFQVGNVANLPVIEDKEAKPIIDKSVEECISLSRADWDAFETSWDFERHPLLTYGVQNGKRTSLKSSFLAWEAFAKKQFYQLKSNEEELNRIFIEIYGLQDELTPEVEEKEVSIRKADLKRDMKSLISYIVGCLFGRYSLDEKGLIFAGGEWKPERYTTFKPVEDNIIPITEDLFDETSLLGRVVEFIKTVYGEATLEDNLTYLANALGTTGQSAREKIAKYLLNDFYNDHVKIYQKRPIYWLFDSGKSNGFKSLIYLHRYTPDTLVKMRLDYVHPTQEHLRIMIASLTSELEKSQDARLKAKYTTDLKSAKEKAEELLKYEQKLHHMVDKRIVLDLDDGVKVNYEKFDDLVAKIK